MAKRGRAPSTFGTGPSAGASRWLKPRSDKRTVRAGPGSTDSSIAAPCGTSSTAHSTGNAGFPISPVSPPSGRDSRRKSSLAPSIAAAGTAKASNRPSWQATVTAPSERDTSVTAERSPARPGSRSAAPAVPQSSAAAMLTAIVVFIIPDNYTTIAGQSQGRRARLFPFDFAGHICYD